MSKGDPRAQLIRSSLNESTCVECGTDNRPTHHFKMIAYLDARSLYPLNLAGVSRRKHAFRPKTCV